MKQIEVDDEIFQYLQTKAVPFVDTPNTILRRLLGMEGAAVPTFVVELKPPQTKEAIDAEKLLAELEALPSVPRRGKKVRSKQRKADLLTLIRAGMIRQSEKLFLVDYQGKKIPGYEAAVANNLLVWQNQHYSMSDLARMFLKKVGYTSDSVRGPAHWCNASGTTIKELWAQFLARSAKR